jgi:hypothetical protein
MEAFFQDQRLYLLFQLSSTDIKKTGHFVCQARKDNRRKNLINSDEEVETNLSQVEVNKEFSETVDRLS